MPRNSDVAIERVPSLCNRISSFKQADYRPYAHGTITDYCHTTRLLWRRQSFLMISLRMMLMLPSSMLNRKPYRQRRIQAFRLWSEVLSGDNGLHGVARAVTAKIRREAAHTLIPSGHARLLGACSLYSKRHCFSVIYDCGLRAFEACNLRSGMTSILTANRCTSGRARGGRTRIVPISPETLVVLKAYRKELSEQNCIFKKFRQGCPPSPRASSAV